MVSRRRVSQRDDAPCRPDPAAGVAVHAVSLRSDLQRFRRASRCARQRAAVADKPTDERADWEIFNGLGVAYAQAAGKPFTRIAGTCHGHRRRSAAWWFGPDVRRTGCRTARRRSRPAAAESAGAPADGERRDRMRAAVAARRSRAACCPLASSQLSADALQLIGRREIRSNNSWMHNAPRLVKGKPRHHLLVHPDDLRARGSRRRRHACSCARAPARFASRRERANR